MKRSSFFLAAATLTLSPVGPAANAVTERASYAFCPGGFPCSTDGAQPAANLISVNGILYGTTVQGGQFGDSGGYGTVFSFDPSTGAEQVLSEFAGDSSMNRDGAYPHAGLVSLKGELYGTTLYGGHYGAQYGGWGTLFSFDPETHAERVAWSFGHGMDGAEPVAGLISVNDTLYGTTPFGGKSGSGTVFSFDPATGVESVLYSFCNQKNCTDGSSPEAGLVSLNGTLYGTTYSGGQYGLGTLFSFSLKGGTEKAIWSFGDCGDAASPAAGLISVKGRLYGTTKSSSGCNQYRYGTVFVLDPVIGAERVLWTFGEGSDGQYPVAGLISMDGQLYGTTVGGGQYGAGTVFALDGTTGAENVVWSFGNGSDGAAPEAGLIDLNGVLYSTTYSGGAYGWGTVFKLRP